MASQVTNWLYDDLDYMYSALNQFSFDMATDDVTTMMHYLASTHTISDASTIYDNNEFLPIASGDTSAYNNPPMLIRPVTGENGRCGIFLFKVFQNDAKIRAEIHSGYGLYLLYDLIDNVVRGAGLKISENFVTIWRDRIGTHLFRDESATHIMTNKANTAIFANPLNYGATAWVYKPVVNAILRAMYAEGMFDVEYQIGDTIGPGVLELGEPVLTFDEMIEYAVSDTNNNHSFAVFKEENTNYTDWVISKEFVKQSAIDIFTDNGIDVEDYKYFSVRGAYALPTSYDYSRVYFTVTCNNFTDDEITLTDEYEKRDYSEEVEGGEGWYFSFQADFLSSIARVSEGGHTKLDRPSVSFGVGYRNGTEVIEGTPSFTRSNSSSEGCGIYDIARSQIIAGTGDRHNCQGLCEFTNFATEKICPQGITRDPDEYAPENPSSAPTVADYGEWSTKNVYCYPSTPDPQTATARTLPYVAVGYGNVLNDAWTQARVQMGEIYSDYYLGRLGLRLENIPDYTPVIPDPEDPDPIKPDPKPTPTPTPEDTDPSLATSRLFTVHSLSDTEVDNLGNFLYSADFISAITNMFTEPMDAIIGCFVLNHGGTLPTGSNERLKLGSIQGDTGVTGTRLTNQFLHFGCGAINVNEFYHNVEDYAPYTSMQLYLPYIGYVSIDTNEVMGGRLEVDYNIDCFTGACLARLYVTKDSVTQELYNFSGNCATMVPLTGRDFTRGVTSTLSGAIGIAGGIATGNAMAAAYGATNMIGNLYDMKRSGNIGQNIGKMGPQKPFLLVKRPLPYNARNYPAYYGMPSNWTVTLGSCSGYTRIKDVHLDDLPCTDQERDEIVALLKAGVIF